MKCPKCQKNEAPIHPMYGVTWCDDCNRKKGKWSGGYPEFVPDSIKDQRREYFKSMLQPYRDGQISKEYVDTYGSKSIKATPSELRKAKNVWHDLPGYSSWQKSR